ncbi:proline/glycine betaine transporter [compost metagenome]
MVNAFPAVVRFSGLSFSYNLAYAIFGGLTPMVVALLMKEDPLGPAYYVAALSLLGLLIGIHLLRRERRAFVQGVAVN